MIEKMARNRRNVRRIRSIKEVLTNRNFFIIIGILIVIIIICTGIYNYQRYLDKQEIAKEKETIEKQSQEVFTKMNEAITRANQNISNSDVLITMSAVGDILCSQEMLDDAYQSEKGEYDFSHMFTNVTDYVKGADIVMGTMETCVSEGEYNSENAPREFAQAVSNTGINVVSISHNHSLDRGLTGLTETKNNLEEMGFLVVGDKIDTPRAVEMQEVKNTKIAFLTYTCFVDEQDKKTDKELSAINLYSEEQAKSDIEYAKKEGADYICVLIHWGDALSTTVSDEQKQIAGFLVENGVDLILGSHPSVVQPMDVVQNKQGKNVFIAYSIGTFISTLSSEDARTELILNIELIKSEGEVYLNKVDYTPIYVLNNEEKAENRIELIDMKGAINLYNPELLNTITRETYDKLVSGLNRLNGVLAQ